MSVKDETLCNMKKLPVAQNSSPTNLFRNG